MKRRFLALSLGIVVLAVLALLLWRHAHAPRSQAKPLFSVTPAAVTRLDARWASGKQITLLRRPSGWQMTAPVQAPADPTRVKAFLAALDEPVSRSYAAADVPLKGAGLAPPRLVLTVNREKAELGRLNPTNGLRYIRLGPRVLLVADTLLPRLAAGPWQFISTRLLPSGTRVREVRLEPGKATGSTQLIAAWQKARARHVGPVPSPAPAALAHVRLTLAPPGGTLGYAVLSRHPLELTRPGSGLLYTFSPAATSRLLAADARTPGS